MSVLNPGRFLALVMAMLLVSDGVTAHQQKQSFTTLLFNSRTGNLEVSHRFLLHDAEHVLGSLFEEKSDLVADPQSRSRFAQYIEQYFNLQDENRQALALHTVGNEVEGKYFWVYQEISAPDAKRLWVRHTALQEVWPRQINYVNVEKGSGVQSLRITNAQEWYEVAVP